MTFWKKGGKPEETIEPNKPIEEKQPPAGSFEQQRPIPSTHQQPERQAEPSEGKEPMGGGRAEQSREDLVNERYGKLRSALGPGTVIQGKLTFDMPVRIDGRLSGEVFSSKALIIGGQGLVDADIQVAVLIVMGKVKGHVHATERVELLRGAVFEGKIECPVLLVEEGAVLNADCAVTSNARPLPFSFEPEKFPGEKKQGEEKKGGDPARWQQ